jgi:hypothetical protein
MPIRQMTQEEVDELFGDAVIQFGVKPQPTLKSKSKKLKNKNQPQKTLPSTDSTTK